MRRRRIAFMLRAMTMVPPSFTTMCANQAPAPPPATEESVTARSTGQPIGGIVVKGTQTPRRGSKAVVPPASSTQRESAPETHVK